MKYNFGLIGYPIKHSLSPWIHKQFLERTSLQGSYSIIEINPDRSFEEAMNNLRKKQIDGFNVTVPYKEKIMHYLDDMDEQAKKIGAVNTVLCKDNKWIGYNTDGIGYVRSLLHKFPSIETGKDNKILLLGAGGAAKGIFHALVFNEFKNITIANRSLDKAENLIGTNEQAKVITLQEAEQLVDQFDIIIQTTSVGMKPRPEETIISLDRLKENSIVSDIVYQPLLTTFLRQAKSLHSFVHFGHTMLLYQAQYAFEIWTNKQPNMENLDQELQNILEG
ncbi:MAG TPA: shikimate dehydrogenase [Pseudogracilibacillus sp.]|nr:shikimate dehydrogenase [Pseudogracilibacillus sp.]